jgi:phage terminase large subunit-like protein
MSQTNLNGPRNYCDEARQYIADVTSGTVIACKWVKLAAERQANDLAKQALASYPFTFNEKAGSYVCNMIEKLPHVKGPLTGQRIRLEPWQVFIITAVFGWVKKSSGTRRFRKVYIEVPKGNGKSALSSGVGIYMLGCDGEGGAEIYSAARTKEQARVVFDVALAMLREEGTKKFREHFGLTVLANSLVQTKSESKFKPLASEANSLEGINPHFACLDELHAHRTREVHDNIQTALPKRLQNMMWCITTAGTNRAGICFEVHTYIKKLLQGTATDDSYFGIIYTIDEPERLPDGSMTAGDDWTNPASWKKANPNYEVSVFSDILAADCNKAMQVASSQPTFLTKNLNVWVNADTSWLDPRMVAQCADATLDEADFEGMECHLGVDLASKIDLAAKVRIFKRIEEDKQTHYYVFGTYWLPEARVENAQNDKYPGWVEEGFLQAAPGEVTDFNTIEESIREDCSRFDVKEVDHDPFQATQMMSSLTEDNITCVDVPRNVKFFSPAMKEFEAMVVGKRFHFNGDPILAWGLSNVVCHRDANDNVFPRKQRPENKIDPAIALLLAFGRLITVDPEAGSSVYDKRGVITL